MQTLLLIGNGMLMTLVLAALAKGSRVAYLTGLAQGKARGYAEGLGKGIATAQSAARQAVARPAEHLAS